MTNDTEQKVKPLEFEHGRNQRDWVEGSIKMLKTTPNQIAEDLVLISDLIEGYDHVGTGSSKYAERDAKQANEAMARIIAALAQPTSDAGWQPIATAPKDGHLLVSDGENSRWVATWASWWPEPGWCTVPGPYRIRPTHWMKLPEAPL